MEPLLGAVAQAIESEKDVFACDNWQLQRIYGGMNSILYRAQDTQSPDNPLAVKIRKRDHLHSASREFSVLQALVQLPEPVAPNPISLHTDLPTLPGDAVISSWIDGPVLDDLSDAGFDLWERILTAFASFHSLRQTDAPHLVDAVLLIRSTDDVVAEIEKRYARLPDGKIGTLTKVDIGLLFNEFKIAQPIAVQPRNQLGLITCDANPVNMIESDGRVQLVDWEKAGWSDPAYDIADLLVRPNCVGVSQETKRQVISRYAEMMENPLLIDRILAYERQLLIFWLILTCNVLVGIDKQRLPGIRRLTLEQANQQQTDYIKRIETARNR